MATEDKLRQDLLAGAEEFLKSARPLYKQKTKYRKSIFDLLKKQVKALAAKNDLDTSAGTWFVPLKVFFPYISDLGSYFFICDFFLFLSVLSL